MTAASPYTHKPPCAWSRVTLAVMAVVLGIAVWVAARTDGCIAAMGDRVHSIEQQQASRAADIREIQADVRWIRQTLQDMRDRPHVSEP